MVDLNKIKKMGAVFMRRARLNEAYRITFDGTEGKRVLADILEKAGVLQTSVVAGDAYMTAFNEGKRALALTIIDEMRWSPMQLLALAEERTDNEALRLGEAEEGR